jgi:MFS family permease
VASLACALATADTFLIIMRGLQGLGAAVVLPAALSIVMNMFSEAAERNKALGIWGGIGAAGATVGLLAGGLLTRYAGWEYIFYRASRPAYSRSWRCSASSSRACS